MLNLLNETIEKLKNCNKSPNDVLWVGDNEIKTTWDNFQKISNVEYDNGYGGAEVADKLLIVGKDFWLERHEYDGSEWWEFKELPIEPKQTMELKTVLCGWDSLTEANKTKEDK